MQRNLTDQNYCDIRSKRIFQNICLKPDKNSNIFKCILEHN